MKRKIRSGLLLGVALACAAAPARGEVACRATIRGTEGQRWEQHMMAEAADGFSGDAFIADGQWVKYSGEFGPPAADKIPTAFWLGSISQVVTAAATLKLMEQGKLALDSPISTYLSPVPERWSKITPDHLLSHRSGLPQVRAASGIADRAKALKAILALQPVGKPGEFHKSDDGYTLLAILIEAVSGQSFESFVQTQIFNPSGMKRAGFWGFEPSPSPVAPPANPKEADRQSHKIWRKGHSVPSWGYRGATGMFSTREDLYYLSLGLRTGKILKASSFDLMLTPSSESGADVPDGEGFGRGMAFKRIGGKVYESWQEGEEEKLGHNSLMRVIGDRLYVSLSNSGKSGSATWSERIDAGLLACANH